MLSIFFIVISAASCVNDDFSSKNTAEGSKGVVNLQLRVPKSSTASTRVADPIAENNVKTVEVLLFDTNGKFTYKPIYNDKITSDTGDSSIKNFTITVPEGTYDMVVLANSKDILANALMTFQKGATKEEVLSKLTLTKNDKWAIKSGSAAQRSIPMWGEVKNLVVQSNLAKKTSINMLRMVSRIDVVLSTQEARDKFSLESVRIYNYNNEGLVAPEEANWDSSNKVVTATTVPNTAKKLGNPGAATPTEPLLYQGAEIDLDSNQAKGVASVGDIFLFESKAGSETTLSNNTCIIIGGKYEGSSENSFYRIEIAKSTGVTNTIEFMSLLRNHNYKINVTKVKGAGYTTPDEAFNARAINIEANIIEWDEADLGEIVFDGQYMLGVSSLKYRFTKEARSKNAIKGDNILKLKTDYPSGWVVEKIVDDKNAPITWLTLTENKGVKDKTTTTEIIVDENKTGSNRFGYIHISAGRLHIIVAVEHTNDTDISITIINKENEAIEHIEFPIELDKVGTSPTPVQFTLRWSPSAANLFFSSMTTGRNFVFDGSKGADVIPTQGTITPKDVNIPGTKLYNIVPPAITQADLDSDPFFERSSIYQYSISDGISLATKSLILKQYVYNVLPVVDQVYLMDGEDKSFGIRTNTPFTVEVKNDPHNIVKLRSLSGAPSTSKEGSRIEFGIVDDLTNPTLYQQEVTLVVKSTYNKFPDKEFKLLCASGIIQPKSNSYILDPKGIGILIPVARANESELGEQLKDDTEFTANVAWTDNSKVIAKDATIRLLRPAGKGKSGYVLILPGSTEGNTVVSINDKSGKILWSWHIWTTHYKPTPLGVMGAMDRNLGAFSNVGPKDDYDIGSMGLYYQWGRKDPMPVFKNYKSISLGYDAKKPVKTVYTANGEETKVTFNKNVPAINGSPTNFEYSVLHPLELLSTLHLTDWYLRVKDNALNKSLWESDKNVYDPCPPGWKVPSLKDVKKYENTGGWTEVTVPEGINVNNGQMMSKAPRGYISTDNLYYPMSSGFGTNEYISVRDEFYIWTTNIDTNGYNSKPVRPGYQAYNLRHTRFDNSYYTQYKDDANQIRCIKDEKYVPLK